MGRVVFENVDEYEMEAIFHGILNQLTNAMTRKVDLLVDMHKETDPEEQKILRMILEDVNYDIEWYTSLRDKMTCFTKDMDP